MVDLYAQSKQTIFVPYDDNVADLRMALQEAVQVIQHLCDKVLRMDEEKADYSDIPNLDDLESDVQWMRDKMEDILAAKEGPPGPQGRQGPVGPHGKAWSETDPRFQEFEARIKDLESEVFD